MGMTREISCDVKGCDATHRAEHDAEGFPSWGSVKGLVNAHGDDTAYLCPEHMQIIKQLLKGEYNG